MVETHSQLWWFFSFSCPFLSGPAHPSSSPPTHHASPSPWFWSLDSGTYHHCLSSWIVNALDLLFVTFVMLLHLYTTRNMLLVRSSLLLVREGDDCILVDTSDPPCASLFPGLHANDGPLLPSRALLLCWWMRRCYVIRKRWMAKLFLIVSRQSLSSTL